jgi:hypothetical protein
LGLLVAYGSAVGAALPAVTWEWYKEVRIKRQKEKQRVAEQSNKMEHCNPETLLQARLRLGLQAWPRGSTRDTFSTDTHHNVVESDTEWARACVEIDAKGGSSCLNPFLVLGGLWEDSWSSEAARA